MIKLNWSRVLYISSVLLLFAGVGLKVSQENGWTILFVASAAAMGGNLVIEHFSRNQGVD